MPMYVWTLGFNFVPIIAHKRRMMKCNQSNLKFKKHSIEHHKIPLWKWRAAVGIKIYSINS